MSTFRLIWHLRVHVGRGLNCMRLFRVLHVKRVKVSDRVDSTGRLVGRRIVLSNMPEVACLEQSFLNALSTSWSAA